jgi:hypothetical protein
VSTPQRPEGRRIDPQGKQALFDAPVQAPPEQLSPSRGPRPEGKNALYSTGPRQVGTVVVECGTCQARSRTRLLDVGLRMLPFTAWLPARRHAHFLRCPACGHMTWCRIGWTE